MACLAAAPLRSDHHLYLHFAQDLVKLRAATARAFVANSASPLGRTRVAPLYAREDLELLEWAKRAVRAFQATLSGPVEEEEAEKGGDFQRRRPEPGWAAAARALEERAEAGGGRARARRFPAVVVGSLLDNVPNVAGLARSCEIFGVSQLCIRTYWHAPRTRVHIHLTHIASNGITANKKVLTEAAFQRQSVSAEHHLPLSELKPKNLPAYLEDMRRQGYTIIGTHMKRGSTVTHRDTRAI